MDEELIENHGRLELGAAIVDRNKIPDWVIPEGFPPGLQDKRWKGLWVDSELEDEWLERLNSIPGVQITASCAGHPDLWITWRSRLWESPRKVFEAATGPFVMFTPLFDHPIERIEEVLGSSAAYVDESETPINMYDVYKRHLPQKTIVSYTPPSSGIFGLFKSKPKIMIASTKIREGIGTGAYRHWWEQAIGAVEKAASGTA